MSGLHFTWKRYILQPGTVIKISCCMVDTLVVGYSLLYNLLMVPVYPFLDWGINIIIYKCVHQHEIFITVPGCGIYLFDLLTQQFLSTPHKVFMFVYNTSFSQNTHIKHLNRQYFSNFLCTNHITIAPIQFSARVSNCYYSYILSNYRACWAYTWSSKA